MQRSQSGIDGMSNSKRGKAISAFGCIIYAIDVHDDYAHPAWDASSGDTSTEVMPNLPAMLNDPAESRIDVGIELSAEYLNGPARGLATAHR
jgi:hypothetical protein